MCCSYCCHSTGDGISRRTSIQANTTGDSGEDQDGASDDGRTHHHRFHSVLGMRQCHASTERAVPSLAVSKFLARGVLQVPLRSPFSSLGRSRIHVQTHMATCTCTRKFFVSCRHHPAQHSTQHSKHPSSPPCIGNLIQN